MMLRLNSFISGSHLQQCHQYVATQKFIFGRGLPHEFLTMIESNSRV
jgi:hypothetical protein